MTQLTLGFTRPRTAMPDLTAGGRPATPALVDQYGRVAQDLRVSLTDRCNLRCEYCMPADALDCLSTTEALSDAEVVRLVTIAVEKLGIREVRFTGGEPLLRRGLEDIVAATTALRTVNGARPATALTTNALGLEGRAAGLAAAGLDRINVSLDSLDRRTFATLTHRDRLPDVLAGLAAADAAQLAPVKINAVLMRGVNDGEAPELLAFALGRGYGLRFIEQMPLGPPDAWDRGAMVTAQEILASLSTRFTLTTTDPAERGSAPARQWVVEPGPDLPGGTVGVISAVTQPFCRACDRTRLTADGHVRSCLFSRAETDLRSQLRVGTSDDEIAAMWRTAMWGKEAGHDINDPTFMQPRRLMSAIGG